MSMAWLYPKIKPPPIKATRTTTMIIRVVLPCLGVVLESPNPLSIPIMLIKIIHTCNLQHLVFTKLSEEDSVGLRLGLYNFKFVFIQILLVKLKLVFSQCDKVE